MDEQGREPEVRALRSIIIDVHEPRDLGYWCRELGLSAEQLRHVIEATGSSVENVRDFVRRAPTAQPA